MLIEFNLGMKKGQIGTTMTWFVATIIVVVILAVSIFIVQFYGSGKGKVSQVKISDSLAEESFYSFLLTGNVLEKLKSEGNLMGENGVLAEKIFNVYKKDYPVAVWIGILNHEMDEEGSLNNGLENEFFGKKPSLYRGANYAGGFSQIYYVSKIIKLNENQDVELVLMEN